MFSAAHRIRVGADWQDHSTIEDPNIRAFMGKVTMIVAPKAVERKRENLRSSPAKVVVKAKGRTYEEESYYARGTNFTEFRVSDEDLITKFRSNASRLLTPEKIDRAVEEIMALEEVRNVAVLGPLFAL